MTFLDLLWNLPALPAIALMDTPFALLIVWLVWKTRDTVKNSSQWTNVLPSLSEVVRLSKAKGGPVTSDEVKIALTNLTVAQVSREIELYRGKVARREV